MRTSTMKGLRWALLISAALMAAPAMAQETAGQMNGLINGPDGQPLANATVRIVHEPSGTAQTVTTNGEGRFIGRGLRLGGPYEITVTTPGGTAEQIRGDVFLALGQPYEFDYTAGTAAEQLVVTAQRMAELATGASTAFDLQKIINTPTVSRDMKDILRGDAMVYVDRFNSDAIQVAGANNRFNLLTIDGVRQSDDFGLNNSGYPSLRPPLSIDFIEQLSVNTAPFGVTYSGFQGGNINVVTKSGTNDFHGSVYGYYSDQSLLGSRTKTRAVTGLKFKDKTYGGTFGGPIIQDKLFFFAGYENFSTSNPVNTGPIGGGFTNTVAGVTQGDYDTIKQIAQNVYGYDMLDLQPNLPETDEKYFGKVNWNINDDHRLVVSYNRDSGSSIITNTPVPPSGATSVGTLGAGSNWYANTFSVDAVSGQLFSDWSDDFKTEVKVGYKLQKADPVPLGERPFAEMQVQTPGGGVIGFGPDSFRHFNALSNKLWTFKVKGDYLIGDHTVTAGVEREMLDVFNAFLPNSYGQYFFPSVAEFQARRASIFNYGNAVTNVQDDGAAFFKTNVNSLYVQDSWELATELTVIGGLRYEWYTSPTKPRQNATFQARYGYSNTETYDGRSLVLPRLSFNYMATDTTVVRGGVGLFGGGNPNVWLSNSFSNDGVGTSVAVVRRSDTNQTLVNAVLNNVSGATVPDAAKALLIAGDGSVNAIDPNFKIPSVWKAALGVDQTFDLGPLGEGWLATADVVYTKVKDATLWVENRVVPTGALTPDGRPVYARRAGVPAGGNDLIMTNTDQGRSWVAAVQLAKTWETETAGTFDFEVGYTFTDVTEVNGATSSTAQSNWDNLATSDINNPAVATSNYELKRNIISAVQWSKPFFGDYNTAISLFGQSRSGRGFSYTFSGASPVFGDPRQGSRQRQLFYVPKDANDLAGLTGGLTWADLDAYIVANGLDKYRGQIAPRNAFRSPSTTQVDMRFSQEIPGFLEGHKGAFTMDIRNVGNMLNHSWGQNAEYGFPYVVPVVQATAIQNGKYVYTGPIQPKVNRLTVLTKQSVWQIQFGLRYEF